MKNVHKKKEFSRNSGKINKCLRCPKWNGKPFAMDVESVALINWKTMKLVKIHYTKIACRLLDNESCKCSQYSIRHQFVPECIVLTPKNISEHAYWLPKTCAYYLVWKGQELYNWHPLVSGTSNSVHDANVSVQNKTIAEFEVNEDEWEDYLWEEEV